MESYKSRESPLGEKSLDGTTWGIDDDVEVAQWWSRSLKSSLS